MKETERWCVLKVLGARTCPNTVEVSFALSSRSKFVEQNMTTPSRGLNLKVRCKCKHLLQQKHIRANIVRGVCGITKRLTCFTLSGQRSEPHLAQKTLPIHRVQSFLCLPALRGLWNRHVQRPELSRPGNVPINCLKTGTARKRMTTFVL